MIYRTNRVNGYELMAGIDDDNNDGGVRGRRVNRAARNSFSKIV